MFPVCSSICHLQINMDTMQIKNELVGELKYRCRMKANDDARRTPQLHQWDKGADALNNTNDSLTRIGLSRCERDKISTALTSLLQTTCRSDQHKLPTLLPKLQWMKIAGWRYEAHSRFTCPWLPYPALLRSKGLLGQGTNMKRDSDNKRINHRGTNFHFLNPSP